MLLTLNIYIKRIYYKCEIILYSYLIIFNISGELKRIK
jgi:hypothetical protein